MVDLNFLKKINDNFGHEKGNIAIKKICDIVCKTFSHSSVFRLGGDEFVAIVLNDDFKNIQVLLEKFSATMSQIWKQENLEPWERVSAAIGYAQFDVTKDRDIKDTFKRADDLMYENKHAMRATRD